MNLKEFITKLQNLPEHKKKIVLWAVVGILAVVMGFFWVRGAMDKFSKFGQSPNPLNLPSINMPSLDLLQTTTPSNQNPVVQIANWKTYLSSEYGFEIKIPADWVSD